MFMTIVIQWWHIPLAVSVLSLLWALYWPVEHSGIGGAFTRLFMLPLALFVSAVSWAIGGILK
jgi:hypothetical protein